MFLLNSTEKNISEGAENKVYFSNGRYKFCYIEFIYYIKLDNNFIYIGSTISPMKREWHHFNNFRKKGVIKYTIEFIGPFEMERMLDIEAAEITNYSNPKYLLNTKLYKNEKYKKTFSIEDYRNRSISFFREGSNISPMVG